MKPGRELDALVAERVMGWRFYGRFTTDPELNGDRWAVDSNGCEKYYSDVPHYSTEISAAWKIVEFMMSKKREYLSIWGSTNKRFEVELGGRAEAETLPHAICLAALRGIR